MLFKAKNRKVKITKLIIHSYQRRIEKLYISRICMSDTKKKNMKNKMSISAKNLWEKMDTNKKINRAVAPKAKPIGIPAKSIIKKHKPINPSINIITPQFLFLNAHFF